MPKVMSGALQTCQLPLRYNGRDVASCMSWQGRSGCWAQAGKWIPCGPDTGATGPAANVTGADLNMEPLCSSGRPNAGVAEGSATETLSEGHGCTATSVRVAVCPYAGEAVHVGPFINRTTTDGRFCRIPVVFEVCLMPAAAILCRWQPEHSATLYHSERTLWPAAGLVSWLSAHKWETPPRP
jgi:hypothetical protein